MSLSSGKPVRQTAADFFELSVDRGIDNALRGVDNQGPGLAVRIWLDMYARHLVAGKGRRDRRGEPRMHGDGVRLRAGQALEGHARDGRESALIHAELAVQ